MVTDRCWLSSLFMNLGKAGGKVGGMLWLRLLLFRAYFYMIRKIWSLANCHSCKEPAFCSWALAQYPWQQGRKTWNSNSKQVRDFYLHLQGTLRLFVCSFVCFLMLGQLVMLSVCGNRAIFIPESLLVQYLHGTESLDQVCLYVTTYFNVLNILIPIVDSTYVAMTCSHLINFQNTY